ncbi:MAG: hypothetical protein LBG83_00910 [Oscillospiraceae bacterium]|jgi:hypothetical protein|nr:hypothetical protein [Oscillospiraceae bacterium]
MKKIPVLLLILCCFTAAALTSCADAGAAPAPSPPAVTTAESEWPQTATNFHPAPHFS